MIKAVLFDMDGIIFDTEKLVEIIYFAAGEEAGIPIDPLMLKNMRGRTPAVCEQIKLDYLGEENSRIMSEKYKSGLLEYKKTKGVPVKDGVAELFAYLKEHGYKSAIVTSSSISSVKENFNHCSLEAIFDAYVTAEDVKTGKPDPEPYLKACEKLGLSPGECIVVEDSKNGIISGNRAGCTVVMVPDLDEPDDETLPLIHHLKRNIKEVISLL